MYEADGITYGTLADIRYPLLGTTVYGEVVYAAEGLTLIPEKIEQREGFALCWLRLQNRRTDGRSICVEVAPSATFCGKGVEIDGRERMTEMILSKIPLFCYSAGSHTCSNLYITISYVYPSFRSAAPGEELWGVVVLDEVEGAGELELQMTVKALSGQSVQKTIDVQIVCDLPGA